MGDGNAENGDRYVLSEYDAKERICGCGADDGEKQLWSIDDVVGCQL